MASFGIAARLAESGLHGEAAESNVNSLASKGWMSLVHAESSLRNGIPNHSQPRSSEWFVISKIWCMLVMELKTYLLQYEGINGRLSHSGTAYLCKATAVAEGSFTYETRLSHIICEDLMYTGCLDKKRMHTCMQTLEAVTAVGLRATLCTWPSPEHRIPHSCPAVLTHLA